MKTPRLHSCNVLRVGPDARHLWQFATGNSQVNVNAEQRLVPPTPLPGRLVNKDWRALWQKKLNVAWLPAEQVFLRVVHLPSQGTSYQVLDGAGASAVFVSSGSEAAAVRVAMQRVRLLEATYDIGYAGRGRVDNRSATIVSVGHGKLEAEPAEATAEPEVIKKTKAEA